MLSGGTRTSACNRPQRALRTGGFWWGISGESDMNMPWWLWHHVWFTMSACAPKIEGLPEKKVVQVGQFKIGLCHGSQLIGYLHSSLVGCPSQRAVHPRPACISISELPFLCRSYRCALGGFGIPVQVAPWNGCGYFGHWPHSQERGAFYNVASCFLPSPCPAVVSARSTRPVMRDIIEGLRIWRRLFH